MKLTGSRAMKSCSTDAQSRTIEPNSELSELYQEIIDFDIDGKTVELSFSCRLAKENGWCREYARQVVFEYKRFLFLAATADHPVSPSSPVDKAWHLHLTYTSSYWERLCGNILGKAVHHHRSDGGSDEANKYRGQYLQTLRSYKEIFGSPPNPDIWLRPRDDWFEDSTYSHGANTKRSWINRAKGRSPLIGRTVFVGGILSAALILLPIFAANAQDQSPEGDSDGCGGIILWGLIMTLIVGWGIVVGKKCPACGRRRAMERTGAKQKRRRKANLYEWFCKYCDHHTWEEEVGCG